MKTIGLIGGLSWESPVPYYRIMNEKVRDRLGGLHAAKIVLDSVDFQEFERLFIPFSNLSLRQSLRRAQ